MIIVLPLLTVFRLKSVSVCVLNIVISVIINGKLNKFIKFSDTTREEVSLLGTAGIISGYEDGTFKPNNSITREEASMLLYKTAQYMGYNDFYEDYKLSDYKYADDEEIGEWAKEAVYQMNKAEIMTGMGDDMFSPKSNY